MLDEVIIPYFVAPLTMILVLGSILRIMQWLGWI